MRPKLSGVATKSASGEVLPDAVRHHACGERVVGAREFAGEREASAAAAAERRAAEHFGETARDRGAGLGMIAARKERGIRTIAVVADARCACGDGNLRLEFAESRDERGDVGVVAGFVRKHAAFEEGLQEANVVVVRAIGSPGVERGVARWRKAAR